MASNLSQGLFQCSGCQGELNLESKTLPCLHSFCHSCLNKHFEGETNKNCLCPECHKPLVRNQLILSPFLVKLIRCRQLESTVWRCDLCLEDGIKANAQKWCHDCQKLLCANCSRIHQKLQLKHIAKDLDGIDRDEVKKAVMTDMCSLHQMQKNWYCERCNACFCDKCYGIHPTDSPRCSSQLLSVKMETLKKKSEGPTLAKKIDDIERNVRCVNERTRNFTEELNSNCKLQCEHIWQNFEEMMKNARRETEELCEEIRQKTAEQVKQWHHILEENEKILKQLEIWRINLCHLLNDSQQDVDVVCGLQLLGAKLTSLVNEPIPLEEECQLQVSYSSYWQQVLQNLKSVKIGSVSLKVKKLTTQHLQFNKLWDVPCWNSDISSIIVSDRDNHVFLSDCNNSSVIEFTEGGDFVTECILPDSAKNFHPRDICLISNNIFVVCGAMKKLIFLEKKYLSLKIRSIVETEDLYYSLCQIKDTIYACNLNFQIDSFTKDGQKIKTIKNGESWDKFSWPLIRTDPLAVNFLGTRIYSSEVYPFSEEGRRYSLLNNEEPITDFCVNECGHVYFCNFEGVFLLSPKKKLHEFVKKPEELPRIFVLRNKIFVSLKIEGKCSIEIFKIKK